MIFGTYLGSTRTGVSLMSGVPNTYLEFFPTTRARAKMAMLS